MKTTRVGAVIGVALAALSAAVPASLAVASVDAPVDAGDVQIVDPANRSSVLSEGRSDESFSLRLPDDATCPGDSAHDQWRIQSFIVPATDDPGALEYDVIKPKGDGRLALYDTGTQPYAQKMTEFNPDAGQPARLTDMPAFSFRVFPAGTLPDGAYRIGIACTLFRETAKFWDVEIAVTADPSVAEGGMTWRLAGASTNSVADDSTSTTTTVVFVVLVAAAVVTAGVAASLRRRRRDTPSANQPAPRPKERV